MRPVYLGVPDRPDWTDVFWTQYVSVFVLVFLYYFYLFLFFFIDFSKGQKYLVKKQKIDN